MPTCGRCKQSHFGLFELKAGFCKTCREENERVKNERNDRYKAISSTEKVDEIVVTTENHSGLKIVERLEIVSAECAFGMNIFKDLFSGVRDIVGGRSEAIQQTLRDSRAVVLSELRNEAALLGANAVIGVEFNYVDLSSAGNMVLLVATGTAVKLAD